MIHLARGALPDRALLLSHITPVQQPSDEFHPFVQKPPLRSSLLFIGGHQLARREKQNASGTAMKRPAAVVKQHAGQEKCPT
jgi:hypothetical protein